MFAPRNPARLAVLVIVLMLGLSTTTVMAQDGAQTSPEENKAFIAEYLTAISGNEKSPELQDQYIAESDQALKDHILMLEAAFPRYELIPNDMIAEGDKVVVRATFRGVHQAEFAGVPATGRQVEMPAIIIYRVADGKIVEHWLQADLMRLMQQLQGAPTARECLTQEGAEAFAERFDAIFDGPSMEIVDELFAPDFVSHLPLAPELDRQGWKDYVGSFYEGLSDLTEQVDEVIVGRDRVVLIVTYTGTHDGPLFGIPPTGKKVTFSGIGTFRFNDDCQVVENTAVVDVVGLLAPVGAFPPGQGSDAVSSIEPTPDFTWVTEYDPSVGELPEGIAVDQQGNVNVGIMPTGEVRQIAPDGTETLLHKFPAGSSVLGLALDESGSLYVGVWAEPYDPAVHGVWKIEASGEATHLPGTEAIGVPPNGLAFDPQGNLYVTASWVRDSDPPAGSIWRIPPGGEAELWYEDVELLGGLGEIEGFAPLGANGIAYYEQALYVGNLEKGHIVRFPILPDGEPGEAAIVAADPGLYMVDGIIPDADGTLLAVIVGQDSLVRVKPETGQVEVLASGAPLDGPASLTFGAGEEYGNTLYITNFAIVSARRPGVLKMALDGTAGRQP